MILNVKAKVHISEDGVARKCTATKRPCALEHFDTKEAAVSYNESRMTEIFGNTPEALKKPRPKLEEVELANAFGVTKLVNGDLSILASRSALINGLCGDLALAVQKKTGGNPYFVCYGLDSKEDLAESFAKDPDSIFENSTHVLIESPTKPNHYIDAYGQKSVKELAEYYGDEIEVFQGDMDMLRRYANSENDGKLDDFADSAIMLDRKEISYDYNIFEESTSLVL